MTVKPINKIKIIMQCALILIVSCCKQRWQSHRIEDIKFCDNWCAS